MHLSSVLSLDGVPCLEKWFGQFTGRMWKQNIKWQHLPPPILAFHIRRVSWLEIIPLSSAPSAQHWQSCPHWPGAGGRHDGQSCGSRHSVVAPRS